MLTNLFEIDPFDLYGEDSNPIWTITDEKGVILLPPSRCNEITFTNYWSLLNQVPGFKFYARCLSREDIGLYLKAAKNLSIHFWIDWDKTEEGLKRVNDLESKNNLKLTKIVNNNEVIISPYWLQAPPLLAFFILLFRSTHIPVGSSIHRLLNEKLYIILDKDRWNRGNNWPLFPIFSMYYDYMGVSCLLDRPPTNSDCRNLLTLWHL